MIATGSMKAIIFTGIFPLETYTFGLDERLRFGNFLKQNRIFRGDSRLVV